MNGEEQPPHGRKVHVPTPHPALWADLPGERGGETHEPLRRLRRDLPINGEERPPHEWGGQFASHRVFHYLFFRDGQVRASPIPRLRRVLPHEWERATSSIPRLRRVLPHEWGGPTPANSSITFASCSKMPGFSGGGPGG